MENLSILSLFFLFLLFTSIIFIIYPILIILQKQFIFESLNHKHTYDISFNRNCINKNNNDEENNSFPINNSKLDPEKNKKLTKKILVLYFIKRSLFTYHTVLPILFYFLKDRNYYILPLTIHLFFFCLALFNYFSILTIFFASEGGALSVIWFEILLASLICIVILITIKILLFFYCTEKNSNNSKILRKNSKVLYFENGLANMNITENDCLKKSEFLELSLIIFLIVSTVFFIVSTFEIFFTIDNMYDPLIGLLICFLFDFFVFRIILILSVLLVFLLKSSFDIELLKRVYYKDEEFKLKLKYYLENLKDFHKNGDGYDDSKMELKSTDRLVLINDSSHIMEKHTGKAAINLQTFGNNNNNKNPGNVNSIIENPDNNDFTKNKENLSQDINPMSKDEIEEKIKRDKGRKIEEITSKFSDIALRIALTEVLNNDNFDNMSIGKMEILEENYGKLQLDVEIDEIIINEGLFYKIPNEKSFLDDNNMTKIIKCAGLQETKLIIAKNKTKSKKESTQVLKKDNLNEFSKFAEQFLKKQSENPLEGSKELSENQIFNDYLFIPNSLYDIKKKNRHLLEENQLYNEKDNAIFSIKDKMVSPDNINYLEIILNKIKPGWFSEIFDKISNKSLQNNLKTFLTDDIKNITKMKENYQIGKEEYEEGRFKPLFKENDYEEIIVSKGIFYSNNKMSGEKEEEKKNKQSSTLKKKNNNFWIKEFLKFSDESLEKIKLLQSEEENTSVATTILGTNQDKETFQFKDYEFIPNMYGDFLKKPNNPSQNKMKKDKYSSKIQEKMRNKKKKTQKNNATKNNNEEENIDDLTPTKLKSQVNSPFVKHNDNISETKDKFNFHKNKLKKHENTSSKNSKITSPNSGLSNLSPNDKNNGLNLKYVNNFFDAQKVNSNSDLKDPRIKRYKSKFLHNKNLSINTKDPNSQVEMKSISNISDKDRQKLEYLDLDSNARFNLEENKRRAMIGIKIKYKKIKYFAETIIIINLFRKI